MSVVRREMPKSHDEMEALLRGDEPRVLAARDALARWPASRWDFAALRALIGARQVPVDFYRRDLNDIAWETDRLRRKQGSMCRFFCFPDV